MVQVPQLSTHPTFVTQLWYGRPVAVLFLFIPRLGVGFRIRTEERLRVTGFQDRRHQPLDQPDIGLMDLDTAPDFEEVLDGGGRIRVFSDTFHGVHDIFAILLDLCYNGVDVVLDRE